MLSVVVLESNNKKQVNLEPDSESHGIKYLKAKSQWIGQALSIFLKLYVVWGKSERGHPSVFQYHLPWPLKAANLRLTFLHLFDFYSWPLLSIYFAYFSICPSLESYPALLPTFCLFVLFHQSPRCFFLSSLLAFLSPLCFHKFSV